MSPGRARPAGASPFDAGDPRHRSEPAFSTLVECFRAHSLRHPERRALTYLKEGAEPEHLTYGEVDLKARAIAAVLQEQQAVGERVLILPPQGLEYVTAYLGCLYAGAVAVTTHPPPAQHTRPISRLLGIAADSRPAAAFTTVQVLASLERRPDLGPDLQRLRWITPEAVSDSAAEDWREPEISGETIAYLQYSSGSTAAPNGVMVSHANLLYNAQILQEISVHTDETVVVSWLPLHHDMGLIMMLLQAFYIGGSCVLMSPSQFVRYPYRWLEAISQYRGTTSGSPNFGYDLCTRRVTPAQREALDLSSWTVAYNAAEPVRGDTLARFAEAFAPQGFQAAALNPCYGLAEATLIVSGEQKGEKATVERFAVAALEQNRVEPAPSDAHSRELVACGRTLSGQEIAIVDPETCRRCSAEEIGEIWVRGPSVPRGYWERPDLTEQIFHAYTSDTSEGPFLRTGDLGFLRNDRLFVAGRRKDVIILAGCNHHPQDIERTAEESHPSLRPTCCAAVSAELDGEERLLILVEVERTAVRQTGAAGDAAVDTGPRGGPLPAIRGAVRRAVTEAHDIPVHAVVLLLPGSIPKTSSGKIQRHACRNAYLSGTLAGVLD